MATNYPTSLDTLTNPTSADKVDTVDHAAQHANSNDAIEALEAKVGADSSAVTTSHDYKLSGVTGSDKAASLTGSETLTNKKVANLYDANGNENLSLATTASAVNNVQLTNSATGNGVLIGADGDDTDVDVLIKGKGTGVVKLGDGELSFPDADGSNGQVLQTNGSGTLSFTSTESTKLAVTTTEVQINNTASETTIFSQSIGGGVLGTNNAVKMRIIISNLDKGARTLTLRFKYGSTTLATAASGTNTWTDGAGIIEFELAGDGSTSAQKGFANSLLVDGGSQVGDVTATRWFINEYGTATEDSTGALNMAVTAQFSSADSGDFLNAEYAVITQIK